MIDAFKAALDLQFQHEAETEARLGGTNRGRYDRIWEVIQDVDCEPFRFELRWVSLDAFKIQAVLWRKDTNSGNLGWGYGGNHYIAWDATPDAIVKRCFVAARDYSEHEVREAFTYKGRRVFDPHQSIENLWEISRDA